MKSLFVVLFSFISFGLFAKDEVISEDVFKKVQIHLSKEENLSSQILTAQCIVASGSLTCAPPCASGATDLHTLPEANGSVAFDFLIAMAGSMCPNCNHSITSIEMSVVDCIELP